MATTAVLPYELYTDAPGTLFVKREWEEADAAHPSQFDFGDVPEGWPKKLTGPLVWDGKQLNAHRNYILLFNIIHRTHTSSREIYPRPHKRRDC